MNLKEHLFVSSQPQSHFLLRDGLMHLQLFCKRLLLKFYSLWRLRNNGVNKSWKWNIWLEQWCWGIVHRKMKMYSSSSHPRCRWVCFFIGIDLTSLVHLCILCSEWVPSEYDSKLLIKTLLLDSRFSDSCFSAKYYPMLTNNTSSYTYTYIHTHTHKQLFCTTNCKKYFKD